MKNIDMVQLKIPTCLIFSIFLLIPSVVFSQSSEQPDSSANKILSAAREIMSSSGSCALITLDKEGRPRARAMDPFLPESDFTVWFGTNRNTRKVDQIKNDPRVTVYYLESEGSGYVMIYGMAQLIDDQIEKERRWKDEWEAFYSNKSEDYVLIKVSPEWLEVVSYAHGLIGDTVTWIPPSVILKSK